MIATTHYEGLKALALADSRFQNGSVGFDLATMTPTFRLTLGIPGSSSALAVAARYGLPGTVIERAERFLSREDQTFESLVKKLHAERAALELAREAALAREEEARGVKAHLLAELEQAKDRDKRAVSREAEALLGSLRRAKEDLRAAQARLRNKKVDESDLREASRAIVRVASQAALGGELESVTLRTEETAPVRREELKRGTKVYVPKLRAEAEVLELTADRARVAVGPMKLTVSVAELRASLSQVAAEPLRDPRSRSLAPSETPRAPRVLEVPMQTEDNTCDLRGLRADDAVPFATSFLDRALHDGQRVVFLVHGHGTGALRDAIRKELRQSAYVAQFRAGESGEGGDGVTVAWLA